MTVVLLALLFGDHPPITDRNYTLDLYTGAALGSARIVGMGGTTIATGEGSASMAENAASAAVRPATSNRNFDWDFHLDWLNPGIGSDFDNNGDPTTQVGETLYLTLGLLGQWKQWGLGASATILQYTETLPDRSKAQPTATITHLVLARSFLDDAITIGVALRIGSFSITKTQTLFSLTGSTLEAGALWRPQGGSVRIGASMAAPVSGNQLQVNGCDPMSCEGFILPNQVVVPWEIAGGIAWRWAPTPWNVKVPGKWRDERELILALDVVVDGPVQDGAGIEAFLRNQLQFSGRDPSPSVRAGAEYEWVPGWFRIRGGSYWEPGRFVDSDGRLHATLGFDVRLFSFGFWGDPYRLRLSFAADAANKYGNAELSIGFWH